MKTKSELEKDILAITMRIQKEFPELSKYIAEMPRTLPTDDSAEIEVKNLNEYYKSLDKVLEKYSKTHAEERLKKTAESTEFPGYPLYPASEDIYSKGEKEMDLNPEDISKHKTKNQGQGTLNEKDFDEDMSGDDLDVPGSELDDQQESVGSEDEENNYYSLGGDNHNDLEEDKG